MNGDGWTIDELSERAARVLTAAGVGAPNSRVTAAPDRRAIRWYATIGLLDPPLRTRGRTARYGERHLLQLVAIKRRQAAGRSLTEIQAELAGATDRALHRIADLPPDPATGDGHQPGRPGPDGHEPGRTRFWAEAPATPQPEPGPAAAPAPDPDLPAPVYPVPLHQAVTLLLPAPPTAGDLAALRAAAGPLLDTLADRGLLTRPAAEENLP